MKGRRIFVFTIFFAVLTLFFTAPAFSASGVQDALPPTGALASTEARQLMDRLGDELVILDVRTPAEFQEGHIPGALLLPVQTLAQNLEAVPADKPVLIVCRTGRRASAAYDMLHAARPDATRLWFLQGTPRYNSDGTFVFQ